LKNELAGTALKCSWANCSWYNDN